MLKKEIQNTCPMVHCGKVAWSLKNSLKYLQVVQPNAKQHHPNSTLNILVENKRKRYLTRSDTKINIHFNYLMKNLLLYKAYYANNGNSTCMLLPWLSQHFPHCEAQRVETFPQNHFKSHCSFFLQDQLSFYDILMKILLGKHLHAIDVHLSIINNEHCNN